MNRSRGRACGAALAPLRLARVLKHGGVAGVQRDLSLVLCLRSRFKMRWREHAGLKWPLKTLPNEAVGWLFYKQVAGEQSSFLCSHRRAPFPLLLFNLAVASAVQGVRSVFVFPGSAGWSVCRVGNRTRV